MTKQDPGKDGVKEKAKVVANGAAQAKASPADTAPEFAQPGFVERIKGWGQEEGPWWLCSFVFHLVLVCSLALFSGRMAEKIGEAPSFEEAKVNQPKETQKEMDRFDVGTTPDDPTELNTETLTLEKPAVAAQEAEYNDESTVFEHKGGGMVSASNQPSLGGLGGFDIKGIGAGPAIKGKGGVGIGVGTGTHPGSGGSGWGFGGRGSGSRKAMLGSGGGTRQSERAVAAALNWLWRHQSPDGSWNYVTFKARCKDATCTNECTDSKREMAATAMGLLPFLGAGQTHESKGPYKQSIYAGIYFLIRNQKKNGDLRGSGGNMYDHGLASIALCECYGMTGDAMVQKSAQAALNFIMEAQDPTGGGWRYTPGSAGDTSVTGWQIMALKSGQMAYLTVNQAVFDKAKQFLKSCSSGGQGSSGGGGLFGYVDKSDPSATRTSIGLLCSQYMGMQRMDPAMIEGTAYIMQNQPSKENRSIYYWYYGTQVMHNQPGADWDTWNRKVRRALIDSQDKEGCAAGSWSPTVDHDWFVAANGGRIMETALSALTLEVYYRYLPLYKLDKEAGAAPPAGAADKPAAAKPPAEAAK